MNTAKTKRTYSLFRVFGFEVKLDLSWLLLGFLITWTLAQGLFPQVYPDLAPAAYWSMGLAGALGVLFSIVFHELSHSLVGRRYGVQIHGITLFIFGGMAEMREEADRPRAEFVMAVAGPISSLVLAAVLWALSQAGTALGWPTPATGVLYHLGYFNVAVAIFNLVPAFPLDGGRMLRAGLWAWQGDLERATRLASFAGSGFAFLLIGLGIASFIAGSFIGGMWWVLIGMFLHGAARSSYQQVVMRAAIEGRPVSRFMREDPVTVGEDVSLQDFVDDTIYRHHFKFYPVTGEKGRLVGCISTDEVKEVPREKWQSTTVADVMRACTSENTVSPETDAAEAVGRMLQPGSGRLLVVDDDELVGILALKDLREYLSLRLELESR